MNQIIQKLVITSRQNSKKSNPVLDKVPYLYDMYDSVTDRMTIKELCMCAPIVPQAYPIFIRFFHFWNACFYSACT